MTRAVRMKKCAGLGLLSLLLFLPQAAMLQPAVPGHPMDALTADEIETAVTILRESGRIGANARFPTLTLLENDKAEVWAWQAGEDFGRRAFAIVMEGVSGVGAEISTLRPRASTAFIVVFPNTAIRVSFCLKSGKFSNRDLIPLGLKNTRIS